ncbi:uncharacterized protein METZ01_LOCUS426882 [marine metagenome]|uniref:Uncharacterized protein n=1 Tax=marine metagenome TaxID=408172 RepID=A0A382XUS5_9ZZZZ
MYLTEPTMLLIMKMASGYLEVM